MASDKKLRFPAKLYFRILALFLGFLLELEKELRCNAFLHSIPNPFLRIASKIAYLPVAAVRIVFFHPINLTQLGLIVTTHCSLNCLHCCDWIPYIKERKHFPLSDLLADIDSAAAVVDKIYNFDIFGGEPLLRKDISEIANHASAKPNINHVRIITNGTLLPSESVLSALKKDKLVFRISDYGEYSNKIHELKKLLDKHNIPYQVYELSAWSDLGPPLNRKYTREELHRSLSHCFKRECNDLFGGAIYPCANVHTGILIGAIPDNPSDYVNIRRCGTPDAIKEARRNLRCMLKKPLYTACCYCSGSDPDFPEIPVAEQIPLNSYIDFKSGEIKKRY